MRYEVSQETLRTHVSVEEAKQLMDARGRPLGGRDALTHFLYRVMLTLLEQGRANQELRKQIERLKEPKKRLGTPTTLSPLDAVKFAAPEELAAIMGHINSTQLNSLQETVADAKARAAALAKDLAAVRMATQGVLNRTDLPAEARVAFVQLLNQLPADPEPVETPRALEMAQLVGMVPADPATAGPHPTSPAASSGVAPAASHPAPVPVSRELPDGDPLADPDPVTVPSVSHPVDDHPASGPGVPGEGLEIRPMSALPQYGRVPDWVPGPGPRVGS